MDQREQAELYVDWNGGKQFWGQFRQWWRVCYTRAATKLAIPANLKLSYGCNGR